MAVQHRYSRLAKIEEKKNIRTAFLFGFLTLLALVLVVFFGIPFVSKVAGLVVNLGDSDQPIEAQDTTPPAPPNVNSLPEASSKRTIDISGSSEPGSTVIVYFNEESKEVVADNEGSFTTSVELEKGENNIFAKAEDTSGNISFESRRFAVSFDDEEPLLEVTKPKEGETFYGLKQKQITVEGKTEEGSNLTINGRVVILGSEGKFSFPSTLGEGENSFNIKSTDQAGNQTELTIIVNYRP